MSSLKDVPLKVRAAFCRACGHFHGWPTDQELQKLERIELESSGHLVGFLCESCNEGFIRWYRAEYGEDPVPYCVLGGTLH